LNINHHLDSATILAYAAGTLTEALSIVAASHISWCSDCRHAAWEAESFGGALLAGLDAAPVTDRCRSQTLSKIGQATLHRFPRLPVLRSEVPSPLARMMGGNSLSDLKWKRKAPGVAMYDLPLSPGAKGKLLLMQIAPGKALPEHGHGGEEITLILSGAYNDKLGRFAQGDVADLDDDVEHRPIVETDAPCICLVATEAPTRFKSWSARLMQPLIRI